MNVDVHDPAAKLRPLNTQLTTVDYLRSMWRRRDFAIAMPAEELRASHQNTLLGSIWHLGNPMLTVGVYYLVFGVILGTSRGVENYTLWLTVGVFAYRLTSSTVVEGARSISSNQGLMRSIRFPRALLPVSVVLSNIYTFGFQLCVLAFVAFATGEGASSRWLALPFVLVIHSGMNLGGAFIAARLNDSFRDIQQIIPFLFNLLRYMSGVMFPIDRFLQGDSTEHAALRPFIENNPMRHVLEMYRWVFLGDPMALGDLARIIAISAALLLVGFSFFRAAEWRYGRN